MSGGKEKCKIAILDNCEIEVLQRLSRENVAVEKTLESYDFIMKNGLLRAVLLHEVMGLHVHKRKMPGKSRWRIWLVC